jgi:hypothetical protein
MGLDITFKRAKSDKYDKYNEAIDEWIKKEPKFYYADAPTERRPYYNWHEGEKKKYSEWLNAQPDPEEYGISECGYFRKVNFLLPYFGYTENCEDLIVDIDDLWTLKKFCNEILDAYKESEDASDEDEPWETLANDLLPTEGGFFFGSTDYDEGYIQDVQEVRDWLNSLLVDGDVAEDEVVVMNCWW